MSVNDADLDFDWSDVEATPSSRTSVKAKADSGAGTSRTGVRRGRGFGEKRLQALSVKLSGEMFAAGTMVGMAFHTTGYYACQESETFANALVELAAGKKEWLEALERVALIGPGLQLGRIGLGIGAAFAVDRQKVDPEKPFLQLLGVTQAWAKANGKNAGANGSGVFTSAPERFTPVA